MLLQRKKNKLPRWIHVRSGIAVMKSENVGFPERWRNYGLRKGMNIFSVSGSKMKRFKLGEDRVMCLHGVAQEGGPLPEDFGRGYLYELKKSFLARLQ